MEASKGSVGGCPEQWKDYVGLLEGWSIGVWDLGGG